MTDKLRLRFSKEGRAIYISHLDLMRTMQRVFQRAGYSLKYSEGYNPHPVISILLPLSVGVSSTCELMDFQLNESTKLKDIAPRLTAVMPEGIRAQEVYLAETRVKELKWLHIQGILEYDCGISDELLSHLESFFARPEIIIEKKTKRGFGNSDIVPAIRSISIKKSDGVALLDAVISAQEPTLNPEYLISALQQREPSLAPDFAEFRRIETYFSDLSVFR